MHVGIANPRCRRKRSRHSRRMRNPLFYVSGKRPIGDHQRSECDPTRPDIDATTTSATALVYAAWALPLRLLRTHGVRTTITRRPSAFRCIWRAPFHGKLECFELIFLCKCGVFILKTNYNSIQVWIISFQISDNVNGLAPIRRQAAHKPLSEPMMI